MNTAVVKHTSGSVEYTSLGAVQVKLVTDFDTAQECARWLSTCTRVAVDTEATGLSVTSDTVRLVAIGDQDTAYVVPLEGVTSDTVTEPIQALSRGWGGFAADMLTRMSGDDAMTIDMHNATYDDAMLSRSLGVHLPRHRIHDTRLIAHVLDSRTSLALKTLSTQFVDPRAALGQDILKEAMKKYGWDWKTIPIGFKPYWFYAGLDVVLTSRLRTILEPRVLADAPDAYDLERAVAWPCADMEQRGVLLDRPYTESMEAELSTYVEQVDAWCLSEYGVSKPGSDAVVADRLIADGAPLSKMTASGSRHSVDKEVLASLTHPLAQGILARRQAIKLLGYLHSYLSLADKDDRIHTSINTVGGMARNPFDSHTTGVRTGRMSTSSPNLQNVPVRTKEGSRIRRCFIPGRDHTWIKCDADQIESRVLAHFSQDPGLIAAFQAAYMDGSDFFVNLGKQLFADPAFRKSDPRRQLVKNGTYAKIYGAGPTKLAKTAGVPLPEAHRFMQSFNDTYPHVQSFITELERLAYQRYKDENEAYARSPFTGRKHRVEPNKVYPIVNYVIQGAAAEWLKRRIVDLSQTDIGQYMLFPVHDEIDLAVPTEDLPDALRILDETMNDTSTLSVPMTWSSDTGPSWGECKG